MTKCLSALVVFCCLVALAYSQIPATVDGQSIARHSVKGGPVVVDQVNGQSFLGLEGTATAVTFDNVDGQSVVDASDLSAATVTVKRLNGQSTILLHAKDVVLADIDGQCTVLITIERGGSIAVGKINGQSRVLWRNENSGDPKPTIAPTRLDGRSRIEKIGR